MSTWDVVAAGAASKRGTGGPADAESRAAILAAGGEILTPSPRSGWVDFAAFDGRVKSSFT